MFEEEGTAEVVVPFAGEERLQAIEELKAISQLINTNIHYMKFDSHKDPSKRKLTSTVPLNLFSVEEIALLKTKALKIVGKL